MLVLARQRDQTVIIGDDIEVTVVDVRGDKVRLGINAPKHVSVHRKEVYEAIRKENREASRLRPPDVPQVGGPPQQPTMRLHRPDEPANGAAPAGGPPSPEAIAAHRPFLQAAIEEARKGLAEGGLPIGSVLVRNGLIVGRGHNRRVQKGDPMAHAEIDALSNAGRQRTYRDTVLYSTLMPCFLCGGASVQFGIPKVVVGESINFHGAPELMRKQGVEVIDLHDEECIRMMGDFIRDHADLWKEDIGK
jgi:cytosine/creatinine deaminase